MAHNKSLQVTFDPPPIPPDLSPALARALGVLIHTNEHARRLQTKLPRLRLLRLFTTLGQRTTRPPIKMHGADLRACQGMASLDAGLDTHTA